MNDIDRALDDIRRIRQQVAHGTQFRGYGPATLASTAAMAVIAALVQQWIVPHADSAARAYIGVWMSTAVIAGSVSAIQMWTRSQRMHSGMSSEMIHMAVQQFLPAAIAGLLVIIVLAITSPTLLWLLPGLWQIIYSLGIASSCRFLPKAMFAPAVWFMATGLAAVAIGSDHALAPWVMGAPFAVGQLLIAIVLYLHNGEEPTDA
jgi:hypothetical protein